MINYSTGEMRVAGQDDQLQKWEVWFSTAEGTHPTLSEALESCNRTGQPPWTIKPVPVALGRKMYEMIAW